MCDIYALCVANVPQSIAWTYFHTEIDCGKRTVYSTIWAPPPPLIFCPVKFVRIFNNLGLDGVCALFDNCSEWCTSCNVETCQI